MVESKIDTIDIFYDGGMFTFYIIGCFFMNLFGFSCRSEAG